MRDASKARMEAEQRMAEMRQSAWLPPVDRLVAKADRMAKRTSELKAIADGAKPLFDSLDSAQKSDLEAIAGGMFASARGPGDEPAAPWRSYRGERFDGPED
jgi:hypothetical protein